ncbi:uncharacterized protein ISCGN_003093 [Ixodes scapularis]
METEGLKRSLDFLLSMGLSMYVLVTDRHFGVNALMRDRYPDTKHRFDAWHVAKGFGSKMASAVKTKKNSILNAWVNTRIPRRRQQRPDVFYRMVSTSHCVESMASQALRDAYKERFLPRQYLDELVFGKYSSSQIERLHNFFQLDLIQGETLLDLGSGPVVFSLLIASIKFKHIVLSDLVEGNRLELNKWINDEEDAIDWSHAAEQIAAVEGKMRCAENAFGVLASRFRIFRRTINLLPEHADYVVMATCALHNYLRDDSVYIPPSYVDKEDAYGNITNGNWRSTFKDDETVMTDLEPPVGHNYSGSAREARDLFCSYFMSRQGAVP